MLGGPQVEPAAQVLAGFGGVAAVVKPAQFGEAIVVGFARQMVEGVAQKVDVTALPGGFGEDFGDGAFETGMVVGAERSETAKGRSLCPKGSAGGRWQMARRTPLRPRCLRPRTNSRQLVVLSRPASSTPRIRRRPSQSMPMATSTARERMTPSSRTFS